MEVRQLRYFLALAEERHFGRAADRLGIAQPGLSQQIKALERSLGALLFDRSVRPVGLTPAGEALLPEARNVVEAVERALDVARSHSAADGRVLKIGTPLLGQFPVLRELLRSFADRFPHVDLRLHPGLTLQNLDALNRGGLDAAVVHPPFESQGVLSYLPLGAHEVVVVLPAGHRLAGLDRIPRAELLEDPFLDWPSIINPTLIRHIRSTLFGFPEHPKSVEVGEAVDGPSRALLVAEGLGISADVVPFPAAVLPEGPGVLYRRVEDPSPLIEYGLAWLETSPLLVMFLERGREVAAQAESTVTEDPAGRVGGGVR